MAIPFSNALYYPHIDITNTNWLKTAALFWDSVSTIVPEQMSRPYQTRDTQYLEEVGFLRAETVTPNHQSVVGIEDGIIELLSNPETFIKLFFDETMPSNAIYSDKMSHELIRRLKDESGIFTQKFSHKLRNELHRLRDGWRRRVHEDKMSHRVHRHFEHLLHDWPYFFDEERFYFSDNFAYVYMTALANQVCEDRRLGLVTDAPKHHSFAKSMRHGLVHDSRRQDVGQGLLLDLIIDDFQILPDTSFEDIMKFKGKYSGELIKFREGLAKLTSSVSVDGSLATIKKEVAEQYKIFKTDYSDFKKALKGSKLKWCSNFMKISALVLGVVGAVLTEEPTPIFVGMGLSASASLIEYKMNKAERLRGNPFSYLLAVEREVW